MPRSFIVRVIACLFLLEWSAPSAIGIAGLGGGFELGIEVSECCVYVQLPYSLEAADT